MIVSVVQYSEGTDFNDATTISCKVVYNLPKVSYRKSTINLSVPFKMKQGPDTCPFSCLHIR